jgi:hypothetical protein
LKRVYNLTLDEYEQILTLQDGCCAICREPLDHTLCLDHHPVTRRVRGLLCPGCIGVLGQYAHDPVTLREHAAHAESVAGPSGCTCELWLAAWAYPVRAVEEKRIRFRNALRDQCGRCSRCRGYIVIPPLPRYDPHTDRPNSRLFGPFLTRNGSGAIQLLYCSHCHTEVCLPVAPKSSAAPSRLREAARYLERAHDAPVRVTPYRETRASQ